MATRASIRGELANRLNDPNNVVWTSTELNGYIDHAIKSLFPTYYIRKVGTTVAEGGPIQVPPLGATNLYFIGVQKIGSTRVRPIRGWTEGDDGAVVPKMGIYGANLFWAWVEGWDSPAADGTLLTVPKEAEDAILLRSHIKAMERLLSSRTHFEAYQVLLSARDGVTEDDISSTINHLRQSLQAHESKAIPLPERKEQ